MLPAEGWADIATKRYLDHLGIELRGEMDLLRGDMGGLRGEMGGVRADVHVLRADMNTMRSDLEASFQRGLRTQLLAMMGFNLSLVMGVAAIAGLN